MRITVVIPTINQFSLLRKNLELLTQNNSPEDFDILVVDNNSDEEFHIDLPNVSVLRLNETIGTYPLYHFVLENTQSDILAFFHSDFFITDKTWHRQVESLFKSTPNLGILGFIGSNEMDQFGGRGMGTCSNFQGGDYGEWKGSEAKIHGQSIPNQFRSAVNLDGCSMIFRRECLASLPFKEDFPPMHHYDRLFCCQALENNWKIGVLGIACDHISGRTMGEEKYNKLCIDWANTHLGITKPEEWMDKNFNWLNDSDNPSRNNKVNDWNSVIYFEAEKQFLKEWRKDKKFIPRRI